MWDYSNDEIVIELERSTRQRHTVDLSLDGKRLAVLSSGGNVDVLSVPDGEEIAVLDVGQEPLKAAFSPNGELLAVHTLQDIQLWHIDPARLLDRLTGYQADFSPDGRLLAVTRSSGIDQLIEIREIEGLDLVSAFTAGGNRLAFSPDGSLLAVAGRQLALWDVMTGELIREFSLEGVYPNGQVLFTPDGSLIVYITLDGQMRVWGVQ